MIVQSKTLRDFAVKSTLDRLFVKWNESKGQRGGLHASSILQSDAEFCYREHVLSAHFRGEESAHDPHLLAVFLHGWYIHEKWQKLFQQSWNSETLQAFFDAVKQQVETDGETTAELRELLDDLMVKEKWRFLVGELGALADEVETAHYAEEWGLSYTPDAIVRIQYEPHVMEIKGYREKNYLDAVGRNDPMGNPDFKKAVMQANLYMHMLGLKKAIILWENKNTQDYHTWVIDYDEELVKPYIARLRKLQRYLALYREEQKVPVRNGLCSSITSERARKCPLRALCFAGRQEREALRK